MSEAMAENDPAAISSAEFFDRARARLHFEIPAGLTDPTLIPASGDQGTDRMLAILAREQPIRPAAVLIAVMALAMGKSLRVPKGEAWKLAVVGLLFMSGNNMCLTWAEQMVSSGYASLVVSTMPITGIFSLRASSTSMRGACRRRST